MIFEHYKKSVKLLCGFFSKYWLHKSGEIYEANIDLGGVHKLCLQEEVGR